MPPSTNVWTAPFDNICGSAKNRCPIPLMAQQKKTPKIEATKIRSTISSIGRHKSEPNLVKRASLSEFMRWWNRREVPLSARCRRAVPIFPLCHRMLFQRRINDTQHQQQITTTTNQTNNIRQQQQCVPSVVVPSLRLATPSSSARSSPLYCSGWRSKACPDGDLLPASWFTLSSEDLFRLHQKLQRRIDRRRSLTKANFPFSETNRRRANILQKYRRCPADLLRRSLSDHHICFMDPKRDVETAISRGGPKGSSWPSSSSKASASFTNAHKKRVSFSTAPTIVPPPPSPAADAEQSDGAEEQTHRFHAAAQHSLFAIIPLPSPSATPVKPILARKWDHHPSSSASALPSSLPISTTPTLTTELRRRIHTVANIGDDSLCAMDYATFRAWRRGSRLSVDVLNNSNIANGPIEVENAVDVAKLAGGARVRFVGWAQLVKRILDDCFRQRKGGKRRQEEEEKGAEEGRGEQQRTGDGREGAKAGSAET